ncbi:ASTRA-associated protein 1 [Lepidopterella palustris CBS 459.81]|uniref:ASTRA-associated protein 1 n=1 Tax=Lepidopterella palustris CBS 459.81 TaxID=1314670 RepID=A0A8E2E7Z1_9PEZI|nr:ASTRA-associated protein 1 [Lepidopterella palustris CBS 459.81]
MDSKVQTSTLPPAQPTYIFRGHTSHIHCVQIVRQNSRLLTGDADGWIVLWSLASKRPVAVWQGHDAAILGIAEWGPEKLLSHGRDNSLKVWQLRPADEKHLSNAPPADGLSTHRPQPWLLHSLAVNTLNFCGFSMCPERASSSPAQLKHVSSQEDDAKSVVSDSILVAVPATEDKQVDIFQLPSERRLYTAPRVQPIDTGMIMALKLIHHPQATNLLLLLAGYESGHTAVHLLYTLTTDTPQQAWQTIYLSQPHTQPILSLDASPSLTTYFTSSADAIIAAHRIPEIPNPQTLTNPPEVPRSATLASAPAPVQVAFKINPTKHSGQQSLRVRSDGRILATAGWDGRVRIYSTKSLKEVAVLKWHREGVYGVGFAEVRVGEGHGGVDRVDRADGTMQRLQKQRELQMQAKHWIVAGSKDGKVSMWEVY